MGSFIALITSRLAGPILGSLLFLALLGNGYQFFHSRSVISGLNSQVTQLTSDNAQLTRDNATLRVNQATLLSGISTQNSAVEGLKSAGELAAANAKAAGAMAAAAAATERTQRVSALKQAKPSTDQCASASTLIRNTLAGEHRK